MLSGKSHSSASLVAIEASEGKERRCSHFQITGSIFHGKVRGLCRYQCNGCSKTLKSETGTPLPRLYFKEEMVGIYQLYFTGGDNEYYRRSLPYG